MRGAWTLLLLAASLPLSGCSDAPEEEAPAEPEPAPASDAWNGEDSQLILDIQGESIQFDVLCTFGGGIEMRRAGGRVLNGTSHLAATVASTSTSTGVQLGYVLTDSPGYDEREQDGITWLPPVRDGEEAFEVTVPPEGIEGPDGRPLWHFYQRMNLPAGELEQDCYTGAHSGEMTLRVQAIRGG